MIAQFQRVRQLYGAGIRCSGRIDADKVYGGPNWLEMDRFDVIGKVPAESTAEGHKLMLQEPRPWHGRRYEVKNASMVDLIRIAYGI